MRLLKFVDGDAPQTLDGAKWNGSTSVLSFPKLAGWQGKTEKTPGSYWLIDDSGKPVQVVEEVVVMRRISNAPQGITDAHVQEVDFRSRMGKQLESARQEYGQTFKTAATKAAAMNLETLREKKVENQKRERETVAGKIERGESVLDAKKSRGEAAASSAQGKKSKK